MTSCTTNKHLSAQERSPRLSELEQAQLGQVRYRKNGSPSAHPWPDAHLWPSVREYLVKRSQVSNPALDERLTAYTPGETLALLRHPLVAAWHQVALTQLEHRPAHIVLVGCAKTKPWTGPAARKSKLYSAYNRLRSELPDVHFVTISEPLGVVPQEHWGDFPQYDNPGLFVDDAQRSGMTTAQWLASPFGRPYGLPFDQEARSACLKELGSLIGQFLQANSYAKFTAFVDALDGQETTHAVMLDIGARMAAVPVERHPKLPAPRSSPYEYMLDVLTKP